MKIKKIELIEFKRFTDITIDLGESPQKVIATVGPNGSGKSSIFDAFEEKQKIYKSARYNPTESFLLKKIDTFDDKENKKYDRNKAIKIIREDGTENFGEDSFYIRTSYRFNPRLNVAQIGAERVTTRPGASTEIDERIKENYEKMIGAAWDEFWNESEEGKTGKITREEIVGKINGILKNVLDVKISNLGNVMRGKGQLYFEKGVSKNFPYENLSAGEKEVIDIIIDLVIKTKMFNDTVFCIDEPELHLSTSIQRKLLVEIEKLVPDNCQLWIATHSIGFLRALQDELKEKTSVLDFSKDDFDKKVDIKPMKLTRDNWQQIFQTALEDITGLLAPEKIIYCEGRKEPDENGEEKGLDAEVYNIIFSETHNDTLFVSSGGNTELDKNASIALIILGKAFENVKLFILKDRDINGDGSLTTLDQREKWIQENPKSRRMLERKEIENYLFDYEIISRRNPEILEEQYTEVVNDINADDVKEKVGDLMNLCKIKAGINKDGFKIDLASYVKKETKVYKELEKSIFGE